jgi:hypothetical protein
MIRLVPNKLIRLGGELYDIRTTEADNDRRTLFFTKNEGALTTDEARLLKNIGLENLDEELSKAGKEELPDFFKALPECQTSSALSLSAKCYKPRYIITEIMRYAALKDQTRHEQLIKDVNPSIDLMGMTKSLLDGIRSRISGSAPASTFAPSLSEPDTEEEDIYNFFLLRI